MPDYPRSRLCLRAAVRQCVCLPGTSPAYVRLSAYAACLHGIDYTLCDDLGAYWCLGDRYNAPLLATARLPPPRLSGTAYRGRCAPPQSAPLPVFRRCLNSELFRRSLDTKPYRWWWWWWLLHQRYQSARPSVSVCLSRCNIISKRYKMISSPMESTKTLGFAYIRLISKFKTGYSERGR